MRKPLAILSILIVLALIGVLFTLSKESVSASEMLPRAYIESPASFEGNTYRIDATIINQIAAKDGKRLLMVKDNTNAVSIPVIIPASIDTVFFPQQRYHFGVTIKNKHAQLQNFKKL